MSDGAEGPSLLQESASLILDFVPVIGSGKSVLELISGRDVITGEEVNRWLAGGGIILGIIPFGKILSKGEKAAKMAKAVGSKIAYGGHGKQELIKKIEKIAPKGTKEVERSFVLQEIKATVRPDELKPKLGTHPNPLDFSADMSLVEQSPARLLYGGHAVQKHWISGGKKDLFEHLSQAEKKAFPSELKDADDVFAYLQKILTDPKTIKIRLPDGKRVGFANNQKKVLILHNSERAGTFYYERSPIKALRKLYKNHAERLLTSENIAKAAKRGEFSLYEAEQHAVEQLYAAVKNGTVEAYQHSSYWSRFTNFNGNRVFQRNDLIDPLRLSGKGETSLQLMRRGRAPIGPDGKPLELHHTVQMQKKAIAEVTQTFHTKYRKEIHINWPQKKYPSGIDRDMFDPWKEKYWKNRAKDFEMGHGTSLMPSPSLPQGPSPTLH